MQREKRKKNEERLKCDALNEIDKDVDQPFHRWRSLINIDGPLVRAVFLLLLCPFVSFFHFDSTPIFLLSLMHNFIAYPTIQLFQLKIIVSIEIKVMWNKKSTSFLGCDYFLVLGLQSSFTEQTMMLSKNWLVFHKNLMV